MAKIVKTHRPLIAARMAANDEERQWLESWDADDTAETLISYVASGQLERDGPMKLNIQVQNPETGVWE